METLRGPPTECVTYVLILDDDSTLARVLGLAMEDYGIPAIVLGSADDGLAWINANPSQLALLLTDISMPGEIDGLELARQIAQRSPSIPIIIMSGGYWSRDFPAYRFLDKPFDLTALMTTVKEALALPH
ncbi:response regulator [Pseudomonas sp. PDM23]|uniref:response regulator n=1 Tax=unclassified Pseudomonas TaxID=196821 RepID=UPI0017816530|nr:MULTISPECIES: response regulator [unclassified Pseudomonas]MBD9503755.1 response regulator [Pseudomonas sp. PDM17]MBD9574813.1 response regulator [Pseudomonas sp. PDM23]MBD9672984.1 response regulator [Pseudomonas sp. PDM21]MBD9676533.1 response regulator [Pseudomonas sp. PDM18]